MWQKQKTKNGAQASFKNPLGRRIKNLIFLIFSFKNFASKKDNIHNNEKCC